MSAIIDAKAIVNPKASLGEDVTVGPFSIIEDDVIVGKGTKIGSNVVLARGTRIGEECKIHHGAVLGTVPQDLKFHGEETTLEIGNHTTIREYATLNRGTSASGKTSVGSHCFIMAYAHVAHDCMVGNHVILANSVNMAGHVIIEDYVVIGGIVPVHQYSRVGRHSMIGGGYRVSKDVPPYILAGHEPLMFEGLNSVGLRRRNFSPESIKSIEQAYDILYHKRMNVTQALQTIKSEMQMTEEVKHIVEFIEKSKRGIIPAFK
ncbi:MAG: acyl-ACP--UDP-N-acetylglucosamine O-acyltransferase [Bacteroidetes bacterium]|nr:MAG: acyl-ACP--UDP-N-acetylglucosamine O-acyltransferase [Bacteroidota bacterium]